MSRKRDIILEKNKKMSNKTDIVLYARLKYLKECNKMCLLYQPKDANLYGQQRFLFEQREFLVAYNGNKNKRTTVKEDYVAIKDSELLRNAPQEVVFVFENYNISPTIIRQCLTLKKLRYVELERKSPKDHDRTAKQTHEIDPQAIRNMENAVKKAAETHDLRYWKFYVEAYKEIHRVVNISATRKNALIDEFCEKVNKIQKEKNLT